MASSSSTTYYFAATAEDKLSSSRQARWDPNAPGCFGVSQDEGSSRYWHDCLMVAAFVLLAVECCQGLSAMAGLTALRSCVPSAGQKVKRTWRRC